VTGTFDNWSKSERLDRVGQVFQKTVTFSDSSEKVFYKVSQLLHSAPLCHVPSAQVAPETGRRFQANKEGHCDAEKGRDEPKQR
jgi:nitrate reductase cytochrome c-type subunit